MQPPPSVSVSSRAARRQLLRAWHGSLCAKKVRNALTLPRLSQGVLWPSRWSISFRHAQWPADSVYRDFTPGRRRYRRRTRRERPRPSKIEPRSSQPHTSTVCSRRTEMPDVLAALRAPRVGGSKRDYQLAFIEKVPKGTGSFRGRRGIGPAGFLAMARRCQCPCRCRLYGGDHGGAGAGGAFATIVAMIDRSHR